MATLGLDQSCTVTVNFRPTQASGAGAKVASLVVGHDGLRSPVTIALAATSIAAQTPAVTVSPTSVAFGNVIVNTNSNAVTLTVRNSGTGNLRLTGVTVGGTNATDFTLVGCRDNTNQLLALNAGQSCLLSVVFRPGVKAARAGNITVAATDITDVAFPGHVPVVIPNATVALSGTGVQGTISPSATTASISARSGSSQTFKLTLTNTGNANFSLQSTLTEAALKFEFVSTTTTQTQAQVLAKFRVASTGCANVAPNKNCQVTITFTPGNVAVNAQYRVNLIINSNASNNRLIVGVTGTQAR